MAVLGFIGICGVLRTTGSPAPRAVEWLAAGLAVAALVVAARGLSLTRASASNTRTGMPWRANASAAMTPTGPPPAINTGCFVGVAIVRLKTSIRET